MTDRDHGPISTVLAISVVVLAVGASLAFAFHLELFQDASLREMSATIRSWGPWAFAASIGLMVVQAVLAPIPALVIAGANGMVFGLWGILVSWTGALLGAGVAFALARIAGEGIVRRLFPGARFWTYVDRISRRHGFTAVLVSRLIPVVSFDLVSYAAGLSSIRVVRFLVATGLGMAPATIVYTVLGDQALKLEEYSRIVVVVVLALVGALVVVWVIRRAVESRRAGDRHRSDGRRAK